MWCRQRRLDRRLTGRSVHHHAREPIPSTADWPSGWRRAQRSMSRPTPSRGGSAGSWRSTLNRAASAGPGVWAVLVLSVLFALVLPLHALRPLRLCGRLERGHGTALRDQRAVDQGRRLCTQRPDDGSCRPISIALTGATGDSTSSEGLELKVIAAVVIGGGSLSGGEGTVLGTLIGCLIMSVLQNGCVHANIPDPSRDIFIGIIIIAAVTLDRLRRRTAV